MPRSVGWLLPTGRVGAVAAKDLRYLTRVPQGRACPVTAGSYEVTPTRRPCKVISRPVDGSLTGQPVGASRYFESDLNVLIHRGSGSR